MAQKWSVKQAAMGQSASQTGGDGPPPREGSGRRMSDGGQQGPTERRPAAAPEGGPSTGAPTTVGPGTHILLFEDDDTLAGLLARVLRADGCHVDVLDSAESIPGAARLARYDVVLS